MADVQLNDIYLKIFTMLSSGLNSGIGQDRLLVLCQSKL